MEKKKKTLSYFRLTWLSDEIKANVSLGGVLKNILTELNDVASTQIILVDGTVVEIRHRKDNDNLLYLHCVSYLPGEEGSTVPKTSPDQDAAPLSKVKAPENEEFLSNAMMCLIRDNHCLFCSDGMTPARFRLYIQKLMDKIQLPSFHKQIEFSPVANRKIIENIINEGVKKLGLNCTLDELDPDNIDSKSEFFTTLSKSFTGLTDAILAKDSDLASIEKNDQKNINAKLEITFRKLKDSKVTQEMFNNVANNFAEEDYDGFFIKTRSGSSITSDMINLRKRVDLEADAKTVSHIDAWSKLEEYFSELEALGQMNQ